MSEKTHWDKPAHFICAEWCRFGMADAVNGYIVSTVGDYWSPTSGRRETIGYGRTYETMVFRDSGKRCARDGCPCGGMPEPVSFSEIDFSGYNSESEARRGHDEMVAKYASMTPSPEPTPEQQ